MELKLRSLPAKRRLHRLSGRREKALLAGNEHGRFELVGYVLMHNWGVPIALDVCLETLERLCPSRVAHLLARQSPTRESTKIRLKVFGFSVRYHIDKGVAAVPFAPKVHGHVQKVQECAEAMSPEHF